MYSTDLDPATKARVGQTQDTLLAMRPVPHHFPKWMRRAASRLAGRVWPRSA